MVVEDGDGGEEDEGAEDGEGAAPGGTGLHVGQGAVGAPFEERA